MPGTYTQILLHVVFATKGRHPWIDHEVADRLYPYIGAIIRERGGSTVEIGGIADHVHVLVRWHTRSAIGDMMRYVKGSSSKWIHETLPGLREFAWQEGYGAFSVSASQEEVVRAYIRNQEAHHARIGFQDELRRLLEAHRVEFDARYAFD